MADSGPGRAFFATPNPRPGGPRRRLRRHPPRPCLERVAAAGFGASARRPANLEAAQLDAGCSSPAGHRDRRRRVARPPPACGGARPPRRGPPARSRGPAPRRHPAPQVDHPDVFEDLFGTPLGLDLEAAAKLYDIPFRAASTLLELAPAIAWGLAQEQSAMIAVRFSRATSVAGHRTCWAVVAAALGSASEKGPQ